MCITELPLLKRARTETPRKTSILAPQGIYHVLRIPHCLKYLSVRITTTGKTCLCLQGLCQHWGFYISCRLDERPEYDGAGDFRMAITLAQSLSNWRNGNEELDFTGRAEASQRVFTMLLCSRVFILKAFIDHVPSDASPWDARRRWVLAQVLPARMITSHDVFERVFQSIRSGDIMVMQDYTSTAISELALQRKNLFSDSKLLAILDEAQDAARALRHQFPSTSESRRSALHEAYAHFAHSGIFRGMILSGIGLSREMVEEEINSMAVKRMRSIYVNHVFTDTGNFGDAKLQAAYIREYIKLSDSRSDKRLLERIQYWFKGRYVHPLLLENFMKAYKSSHRLTASLLELLYSENLPRHRILTSFVRHITGFTITDATDLEAKEGPIPKELDAKIKTFRPLISV